MFGPQTATGGRIRSSIFFFLSRAFWKIEGWSSSDRSPPAVLSPASSSSTKFTIESPGEEGTRGVMERALATGETWREGRRVFLGLVCINFRYGTTSCRIVSLSLFLSGEEKSTVWITLSLPFFLNGALVTRARSRTALKWKKNTKKTTESLVV